MNTFELNLNGRCHHHQPSLPEGELNSSSSMALNYSLPSQQQILDNKCHPSSTHHHPLSSFPQYEDSSDSSSSSSSSVDISSLLHDFNGHNDLESQMQTNFIPKESNDRQPTSTMLSNDDLQLAKYYEVSSITTTTTTSRINNQTPPSTLPHRAKHLLLIMENLIIWLFKSIVFPLISWTTLPIAIYFLLMANFQRIAFKYMYSSEGEFFNQVDFDIIPRIDKTLMFGLGMPHSILANIYHPVLDFFFAIPYLNHFVFPLAFYPLIFCVLLWKPNRDYLKLKVVIPLVTMIKEIFQKNRSSEGTNNEHSNKEHSEVVVNEAPIQSYSSHRGQNDETSSKPTPQISNYKLKCFVLSLGIISLIQIGFCFFFPTAPPWFRSNSLMYEEYYNQFGSELTKSSPPVLSVYAPEARFEMIDKILGVEIFGEIYGKGTIKFGAFYSLHVGWTAIIAFIELYVVFSENHDGRDEDTENEDLQQIGCFSFMRSVWCCQSFRRNSNKWSFIQIFMLEYLLWIFIASIYSAHHYMIDGLVAIILAFIIVKLVTKYLVKDDTK